MIPAAELAWWITLAVAAVVVVVVAVLLELIVRTARSIHARVSDIWTGGTHIAANTVTIAMLHRTNFLARALLESAGQIAESSRRIRKSTERKP